MYKHAHMHAAHAHVLALTPSLSPASAPSDSNFANALSHPRRIAICSAPCTSRAPALCVASISRTAVASDENASNFAKTKAVFPSYMCMYVCMSACKYL